MWGGGRNIIISKEMQEQRRLELLNWFLISAVFILCLSRTQQLHFSMISMGHVRFRRWSRVLKCLWQPWWTLWVIS